MLKKEHLFSQVLLEIIFWGSSEIALKKKVPQLASDLITYKQNLNRKVWFPSAPSLLTLLTSFLIS